MQSQWKPHASTIYTPMCLCCVVTFSSNVFDDDDETPNNKNPMCHFEYNKFKVNGAQLLNAVTNCVLIFV